MADLGGIARETDKLLSRIRRLELKLGTGTARGEADIKDEIGEINQGLRDIGYDVSSNKKPKNPVKYIKPISFWAGANPLSAALV